MAKKTPEEKAKAKAERAARKAAKQRARDVKAGRETVEVVVEEEDDAATKADDHVEDVTDHIAVTGVLSSRADSRDAHITGFSVILFGRELIMDTELKINYGRRYGLIGSNGSGKSTLLKVIANRMIPIPEPIDMKLLTHEAPPSQQTAMEAVMAVVLDEALALEAKMEALMEEDPSNPEVEFICQRLDLLDTATVEKRTGELLFGLGFTEEMMHKKTCDMSGGWRMRVALSQVLLVQPTLLLLDEPTNHLDLGACVWLEDYLSTYPNTLIVVSHSQDFLNSVCTNIMELDMDSKLVVWGGNYDVMTVTKREKRVNDTKKYNKEQDDIGRLTHFIRTCGTYSNLVKQAQSKQKIIDKMIEAGLTPKPKDPPRYKFKWPSCPQLPPPVLAFDDVSFSYSGKKADYLYTHLDLGIDMDSRIALVGPNGAGKSTLLKVSVLLFTVTFHANHAHNLTRSP
jgi:ATP-binding cassette subfamily F protein 2